MSGIYKKNSENFETVILVTIGHIAAILNKNKDGSGNGTPFSQINIKNQTIINTSQINV